MSADNLEHEAARRHQEGVPAHRIVLAREAVNTRCVGCGQYETLGGGLRCGPCFYALARPNWGRKDRTAA